jgi:hypothetical protein
MAIVIDHRHVTIVWNHLSQHDVDYQSTRHVSVYV